MRTALLLVVFASGLCAQDADTHLQRARDIIKGLAQTSIDQAQVELARKELAAALRLRPGDVPTLAELAKVQVMQRDYAAALDSVNQVLRADSKHLEAQLTRASALIGQGKPGVARLFLQDALVQYPGDAEVLFLIGTANLADRRYPEAATAFDQLWQKEPAGLRALEGLARAAFAEEQPERAVDLLKAEAAKAPERMEIQRLLALVAVHAKKYDLAIETLLAMQAKSQKPNGETWALLADSYSRKGDSQRALEAFRKAHEVDPSDPSYAWAVAVAADGMGLKKEAEAAYRVVLALQPKSAYVLNNLAYLLANTGGDLKEALGLAQRARELMPTNSEISDTVGWIHLKSNRVDEALAAFESLVARHPIAPAYRYHLGLALLQKGEKRRALLELKRALKDEPVKDDLAKIQELIRQLEGPQP